MPSSNQILSILAAVAVATANAAMGPAFSTGPSDEWGIFAYTLIKTGDNSQLPVQDEHQTPAKKGDRVNLQASWCGDDKYVDHICPTEGHAVANLFEADNSEDMEALFKRFQDGEYKVLITKDCKTRGLDLPSNSMVINYDIPDADACRYLRQVCRAGKSGRSGFAVNLVSDEKEFESLQSVATSQCFSLRELKSDDWDAVERYLRDCTRSR
ncbi:ATP-dependent RNA helicase DBP5 [Fusarium agapanthi]|uniref:ATP-dependent RNA helicase DBP5 n=1 Tax=Fusarium agapanthi TaxID=1803897 RepID=A0A9P5EBK7_9HYPO|nr:ATP-dependent RNA helicase DBP5 [Fusarium agapanthi]